MTYALTGDDYDLQTRVTGLEALRVNHEAAADCLVVIHAPLQTDLGRRYVLDRSITTIGRGRDNDIVLPSDCVSRRHARLEHRANGLFAVDLASTNGTFINDATKLDGEYRLSRGDLLKVGDRIFKFLSGSDVEAQYHDIIFKMTLTDGLTTLANRKQLDCLLNDEIQRARRHNRELALAMIDIDHFKTINDTYGHLTGDSVLRGLSSILQKRLRPNDKLGRYGGEEFCAILPETSLQSAVKIAEDLRVMVASHSFNAEGKEIRVTVSIGAACLLPDMEMEQLYKGADEKLYQAKRGGRNKVCH
ncbi:MAG: GGDEF domain-containing protein [Steroidobacteraceae bacterium]